ncbi:hypothetical protein KIN_19740 [Litoreibacter roseus]|uniref:Sulfotransferase family protein n=2 Tax=Litoreibacter roseus TaxID=2601869 RepID=A0A6N6JGF1_9RHOB|nr:hypothetical protein KIN_19740 [Litoreibacter roseus]
MSYVPVRGVDPARAQTFAQFVGFPRSGHSLIGALIDAHPRAIVAHELDAMGLFRGGLSYAQIARLIARNARAFADNGKWWNGYSYAVDGVSSSDQSPQVIGDKKGDWAARWSAATPGLLDRVLKSSAPHPRWLLVTRAPEDNIATMTLRRGGAYDRIRIKAASDGVSAGPAVDAAQADGTLPTGASDAMIADYRSLCDAIADMKTRIPPENWLEIGYEAFTQDPVAGLRRIADFLKLNAEDDWLNAASALVHAGRSRSRDRLSWTDAQIQDVDELTTQFDFLKRYERVGA